MAKYSKSPEFFIVETTSIIPIKTPIVLKSIVLETASAGKIPVSTIAIAPPIAAKVRLTFSDMMQRITIIKIRLAIKIEAFIV